MVPDGGYVAVVNARFYYQQERRISHYGLYLVSANGKRKQFAKGEWPFWISHNRVGWVTHKNGKDELWEAPLPSLRKHRILASRQIQLDEDGSIAIDGKSFRFSSKGMVATNNPTYEEKIEFPEKNKGTTIEWEGKTYRVENPTVKWEASDLEAEQVGIDEIGFNGHWPSSVRIGPCLFVTATFSHTAHESSALLFRLDPKKGTAQILPQPGAEVQFFPGGKSFLARSGRRLDEIGNVTVWSSMLYLGQLPLGTYRKIPLPFCNIRSSQVRP